MFGGQCVHTDAYDTQPQRLRSGEVDQRNTHTHTAQGLQAHNTSNKMVVTMRETRCNSKYPSDLAAVVIVSNETHWYMLPIIIILSTVLHNKCLLAHLLSLAHLS